MIKNELCSVVSHKQIAANIFELILEGKITTDMNEPGQFVHVRVNHGLDPLLRRPISIANINKDQHQFTLIYRAEGRGTTLLSQKREGETVDILGPLGNGFPLHEAKKGETALLVGGGIGTPPLYELSKQLTNKGNKVIHVFGFQTKEAVFYEDHFQPLGETYIATIDGTYGKKGLVTDVIDEEQLQFDIVYACGPTPMLRAIRDRFAKEKRVYISLEERMACGIGACFACVCHQQGDKAGTKYKKICSDGPVFKAGEVLI